jgi:hypothetical protein
MLKNASQIELEFQLRVRNPRENRSIIVFLLALIHITNALFVQSLDVVFKHNSMRSE